MEEKVRIGGDSGVGKGTNQDKNALVDRVGSDRHFRVVLGEPKKGKKQFQGSRDILILRWTRGCLINKCNIKIVI
jgi:hypothetical protein